MDAIQPAGCLAATRKSPVEGQQQSAGASAGAAGGFPAAGEHRLGGAGPARRQFGSEADAPGVPGDPAVDAGGPGAILRCGAVLAFAGLVHLVGALARPLAAGAGAVPGGAELVGHLRPREAGGAVLDDGRERFLLALVPSRRPSMNWKP